MKKVCVQCGSEFDAKREDKKTCSPKCRQKHWRSPKLELVETVVKIESSEPVRMEGESSIDFAIRKSEWKKNNHNQ